MNVFEKYDPLGGPYRWVFWAVAAAWLIGLALGMGLGRWVR